MSSARGASAASKVCYGWTFTADLVIRHQANGIHQRNVLTLSTRPDRPSTGMAVMEPNGATSSFSSPLSPATATCASRGWLDGNLASLRRFHISYGHFPDNGRKLHHCSKQPT